MTRILLYSDVPILAKGLGSVLRQVEGFDMVSICSTIATLPEQIAIASPDLILMDLTREVTFGVVSELKHSMKKYKFVLWVNNISTAQAFQAMGLGVRGILRKSLSTELHVKCLQSVSAGELWFEKALTDGFLSARRAALAQRDGHLLRLLPKGLRNKEIATTLMLAEHRLKSAFHASFRRWG